MKYGRVQSSRLRPSGNGCSHIIHGQQKSAAYCQIPQPPALAMMNNLIPGLPKKDPAADQVAAKVHSLFIIDIAFVATRLQT